MKRLFLVALATALLFSSAGLVTGLILGQKMSLDYWSAGELLSPFSDHNKEKEISLDRFSIKEAQEYPFATSPLVLGEVVDKNDEYQEYLFTYQTLGKKMSGLATLPAKLPNNTKDYKVVIMIRGWAPAESYVPGIGTSPAAREFAKAGYITLAPDFFGFAGSDPEPINTWEARFVKPINIIELIKSIKAFGPPLPLNKRSDTLTFENMPIFIWAHSNGGQIALAALEISRQSIPTTLWAPVTAPFPYSVLFYSDELIDEGKEQRAWLALFEKNHNALDFSPTQFINLLTGPLQLHHGTGDDSALKIWSDEFVDKIKKENEKRKLTLENNTAPIELEYYTYAGADHNLRPSENWNQAINRDLKFFAKYSL